MTQSTRSNDVPSTGEALERDAAIYGAPPRGDVTDRARSNPPRAEIRDPGTTFTKISLGLGVFSVALGITELVASRQITRALKADGHEGVVKAFGWREIAAGVGLLQSPAHGIRVWNRVTGDGLDLGALALAARHAPRNKAVWGATAFVAGATLLDTIVALGLDRTTGKTAPIHAGKSRAVAAA